MQSAARRIEPADLKRIRLALDTGAALDLPGLRLRAIVELAHAAALDLGEVLAVRLRRTLDLEAKHRWTVRRPCVIPLGATDQAILDGPAAGAVEAWIRAQARKRRIRWRPSHATLLFTDQDGAALSPRTVQHHFAQLQGAANTARSYRFSDLRHDAISRYAERTRSAALTAQFARISERSALTYLPSTPRASLADMLKHAAWTELLDPVLD